MLNGHKEYSTQGISHHGPSNSTLSPNIVSRVCLMLNELNIYFCIVRWLIFCEFSYYDPLMNKRCAPWPRGTSFWQGTKLCSNVQPLQFMLYSVGKEWSHSQGSPAASTINVRKKYCLGLLFGFLHIVPWLSSRGHLLNMQRDWATALHSFLSSYSFFLNFYLFIVIT